MITKENESNPQVNMYDHNLLDEYEDRTRIQEDGLPCLDNAEFFFKKLLESIYTTGDLEVMEDCLDELSGLFKMRLPVKETVLMKKPESKVYDFVVQPKEHQLLQK